eukprot:PhM_4_TR14958/c0_g1_i1/m.20640/K03017/RPB9, POLR2I; DNA-directed RNA polymerase II subunit RPB9
MPIQFCPGCNNLLYPAEDIINRKLEYVCRRADCGQRVPSAGSMIESRTYGATAMSDILNTMRTELSMMAEDATLNRVYSVPCPRCGYMEIALFMNPYRLDPENMGLICVCCNLDCRHAWHKTPQKAQTD